MDMRRFLLCGSWSAWSRVANPTQCCDAAPPEIAVKRCPHSRLLEVVTPVSLEATYGFLGLRPEDRQVVRLAIGGVKPHSGIGVEHPVTPTLRITELRLNCPPIDPPIDQLAGSYWPVGAITVTLAPRSTFCFHFANCCGVIAGPPFRLTEKRAAKSNSPDR